MWILIGLCGILIGLSGLLSPRLRPPLRSNPGSTDVRDDGNERTDCLRAECSAVCWIGRGPIPGRTSETATSESFPKSKRKTVLAQDRLAPERRAHLNIEHARCMYSFGSSFGSQSVSGLG